LPSTFDRYPSFVSDFDQFRLFAIPWFAIVLTASLTMFGMDIASITAHRLNRLPKSMALLSLLLVILALASYFVAYETQLGGLIANVAPTWGWWLSLLASVATVVSTAVALQPKQQDSQRKIER
jgi:hypothetical protein